MADKPIQDIDDEDDIDEQSADGKKKKAPKPKKPKKEKPVKEKPEKPPKAPKPPRKKRGVGKLIFWVLFLAIVAGLVAVIGFDAGGLRTKYLNGFLQNIPIVKNLIPAEDNVEGEYAGMTAENFISEIDKLKTAAEIDQETIKTIGEKNDLYIEEITRLKEFEDQQAAFKAEKEAFDRMIAMNDTGAYEAFYESINPETAETLYQDAVLANQSAARVKEYIASFTSMDGGAAAEILEQMIPTDINLVVVIINALDSDTRAGILSEMTPENAAIVVKMTAPAEAQ